MQHIKGRDSTCVWEVRIFQSKIRFNFSRVNYYMCHYFLLKTRSHLCCRSLPFGLPLIDMYSPQYFAYFPSRVSSAFQEWQHTPSEHTHSLSATSLGVKLQCTHRSRLHPVGTGWSSCDIPTALVEPCAWAILDYPSTASDEVIADRVLMIHVWRCKTQAISQSHIFDAKFIISDTQFIIY